MSKQVNTFCRICEPACPMIATVDAHDEIVTLEPNKNHPTKGVACHKGLSYIDMHRDPDRMNYPLRRKNHKSESVGDFERVSWDESIQECADKLNAIIEEHGPNAVAIYSGNPGVFNSRGLVYAGVLREILGTQISFSANTQDMSNRMTVAAAVYGSMSVMTPDLANTQYLLCMGSNPRVSKWTVVSTANDSGRTMENIKKRGGKIRFVNPRVTESSTPETGDTLLIKPGADVYFLAAVLHEIQQIDGLDHKVIEQWGTGANEALKFVSQYPAERVSHIVGIDVDDIKQVAAEFVAADGAGIYLSVGVNQGRQGTLAAWLADVIVFLTGNLGRKGGMLKPPGAMPMMPPAKLARIKVQTSLGELQYAGAGPIPLPAVALPELIKNGDIKAVINLNGNALLSVSGESKWREAIAELDLLVSIDIQRNSMAEVSDYVFPATDFLERADINFIALGAQTDPHIQYTDEVIQPKYERKHDYRIMLDLIKAMGRFPSDDPDGWGIINKILGARGLSIEQLKNSPHQMHYLEKEPFDQLYQSVLQHPDKKVHCYPEILEEFGLLQRCEEIFQELEKEPEGTLKMISMRTAYMHNTWYANVKKLRRGAQSVNPLHICSVDADRLCLTEGERVRVFNQFGSIETPIKIDDSLRPGAVAMAHGYGKGRPGQRAAESNPGANANQLAPNTMETVEPLSNMSWIGAYPVEVEKLIEVETV